MLYFSILEKDLHRYARLFVEFHLRKRIIQVKRKNQNKSPRVKWHCDHPKPWFVVITCKLSVITRCFRNLCSFKFLGSAKIVIYGRGGRLSGLVRSSIIWQIALDQAILARNESHLTVNYVLWHQPRCISEQTTRPF